MKSINHIYLVVFLLLVSTISFSQDKPTTTKFGAFGNNPSHIQDSLYQNIQRAKNFTELFNAQKDLIEVHSDFGNIDSVIKLSTNLYNEALLKGNKEQQATTANLIGEGKLNKGFYDDALQWFFTGFEKAKETKNDEILFKNKIGISLSKFARGKIDEGIANIIETIEKAPNQKIKHDAKYTYAKMLFFNKELEKAKPLFQEALTFYQIENYQKNELKTLLNLALLLNNQGDNDEALKLLLDVYNRALTDQYFDIYIDAANYIGFIYNNFEDYENAIKILSTAHANAINWNNLEAQKKVLNNLRLVFSKSNDFKNAYAITTQYERVSNIITNAQNKAQVNELEVKYETLEKEQEIERQRTLKQNILIGFLVVLVPLLGLFYVYYQKLKTQSELNKTQEEVNKQKVASLLKDQELKLIKASVEGEEKERKRIAQELHDSIGGNLATIKLQLSSKNESKVIQQIDDTYNLVRDLSHNLMPKKFKETAFTSLVSTYIDSVKKSGVENISLHLHPEEEINTLNETIKVELYKIVQELLTNALKHAKASQIDVHITKLDNEVKLLYEDNGVGFEKSKVQEGIGFINIRERLKNINGSMHIDAYPNRGTVIDIDVSLT